MVAYIINKLNGSFKWVMGIFAALVIALIVGIQGYQLNGAAEAFSHTPRIERLEKRAVQRDLDLIKERKERDRIITCLEMQKYYLEKMAIKMGVDPPPPLFP